jgi:hypothetical protein
MRMFAMLAGALLLFGCAQQVKQSWVRLDGQSIRENPLFLQQYETDSMICTGETQKANLQSNAYCQGIAGCVVAGAVRGNQLQTVANGCMAQKGYVLVPEDQAAAKAAELRAMQPPTPVVATVEPVKRKPTAR